VIIAEAIVRNIQEERKRTEYRGSLKRDGTGVNKGVWRKREREIAIGYNDLMMMMTVMIMMTVLASEWCLRLS
jgi:hypothetical protein